MQKQHILPFASSHWFIELVRIEATIVSTWCDGTETTAEQTAWRTKDQPGVNASTRAGMSGSSNQVLWETWDGSVHLGSSTWYNPILLYRQMKQPPATGPKFENWRMKRPCSEKVELCAQPLNLKP